MKKNLALWLIIGAVGLGTLVQAMESSLHITPQNLPQTTSTDSPSIFISLYLLNGQTMDHSMKVDKKIIQSPAKNSLGQVGHIVTTKMMSAAPDTPYKEAFHWQSTLLNFLDQAVEKDSSKILITLEDILQIKSDFVFRFYLEENVIQRNSYLDFMHAEKQKVLQRGISASSLIINNINETQKKLAAIKLYQDVYQKSAVSYKTHIQTAEHEHTLCFEKVLEQIKSHKSKELLKNFLQYEQEGIKAWGPPNALSSSSHNTSTTVDTKNQQQNSSQKRKRGQSTAFPAT